MVARGKAVSNVVISGRRGITKPMRKTPSTGRDIEGGRLTRSKSRARKLRSKGHF
jgi:hypothetical protein